MDKPSFRKNNLNMIQSLFRHRWLIGMILIMTGTLLCLNGSSIRAWNLYIPSEDPCKTILGNPRPIRSDEWAVFTPMIRSQYYGETPFSSNSGILSGGNTDTAVVYGLPIRSVFSILFRPFLSGFLLFDLDHGLAFFWCARLIILFLVWFDLLRLLTDQNHLLSFIGSVLICLSPVIQWWFAINGLIEMLIFGGGAILILNKWFHTEKIILRALCFLGFYTCAGGYIATLYPPWMVSFFYVFLVLAVWILLKNAANINIKRDVTMLILLALTISATFFFLYQKHEGTISAVMNSVYPGSRHLTGGGAASMLFKQWGNLFFPYKDSPAIPENCCEASVFLSFFPIGHGICLYGMIRNKKKDLPAIFLIGISVLLLIYCTMGFPEWAADLTFLSVCQPKRAFQAFGFCSLLLLLRGLSQYRSMIPKIPAGILSLVYSLCTLLAERQVYSGYIGPNKTPVIAFAAFLTAYCIFRFNEKRIRIPAAAVFLGIAVLSGAVVNPIQTGGSDALNSRLGKAISAIVQEDPDGIWAFADIDFPYTNYPILFGARAINSSQVYPKMELWKSLDPNGKGESAYNRYAHVILQISDNAAPRFRELYADQFRVTLSLQDLYEKLGVRYILARDDAQIPESGPYSLEKLNSANLFTIYKVVKR